jgi:hypothetical protein
MLLEPDLTHLEQNLGQPVYLSHAAKRFLAADIHAHMSQHLADGIPASLQPSVERNLVSSNYLKRASTAAAKMTTRLYVAEITKPALWMAPISLAMTFITMVTVHWMFFNTHVDVGSQFQFALAWTGVLTAAWVGIEFYALRAIKKALGVPVYERMKVRVSSVRNKIRWAAAGEIVILAWIYGYVPKMIEGYIFPSLR